MGWNLMIANPYRIFFWEGGCSHLQFGEDCMVVRRILTRLLRTHVLILNYIFMILFLPLLPTTSITKQHKTQHQIVITNSDNNQNIWNQTKLVIHIHNNIYNLPQQQTSSSISLNFQHLYMVNGPVIYNIGICIYSSTWIIC